MSAINVYQQRPTEGARGESPLHHAGLSELAGKGSANAGVRLREKKLLGHLTLRGDGADAAFAAGVQQALGLELPLPLGISASGETSLQWVSPDQWLLIVPAGEEVAAELRLREALSGQHIQVVNVSGGQTLLELSGPRVREVLMKSTTYDVHPDRFPVGKAVGTHFAKAGCTIRHVAEGRWELLVRRSFSDYFWLWLQDAAAEYGLAIDA